MLIPPVSAIKNSLYLFRQHCASPFLALTEIAFVDSRDAAGERQGLIITTVLTVSSRFLSSTSLTSTEMHPVVQLILPRFRIGSSLPWIPILPPTPSGWPSSSGTAPPSRRSS